MECDCPYWAERPQVQTSQQYGGPLSWRKEEEEGEEEGDKKGEKNKEEKKRRRRRKSRTRKRREKEGQREEEEESEKRENVVYTLKTFHDLTNILLLIHKT